MESYLFIQISTEVHSAVEEKYLQLIITGEGHSIL